MNEGKWIGVGGHTENQESPEECLLREVKEETGLDIYSPQLCGIKDWVENECRYVVLFYKTNRFDGVLQSSNEGEVWWAEMDQLTSLKLSLDMQDMIRVFVEDGLSEFFYRQDGDQWVYDCLLYTSPSPRDS